MPVDYKTASHLCNVIRRQIQAEIPEFSPFFVVHEENKRAKAFLKESGKISEHPAGIDVTDFFATKDGLKILKQNRSCFAGIAEHNTPGFLGFRKHRGIAAVFFINHARFDNEDNMRNHILHMVWHALALLDEFDREPTKELPNYKISRRFILPELTPQALYHRNLTADIFSSSYQTFQGRNDSLTVLSKQRMIDTLEPEIGFISERFPFPVCIETLELTLKERINTHRKKGKNLVSAINLTRDVGITFDFSSIKQWRSFSQPAQHMAWCGFSPETILGCAIYTSEDTYVRSIADMVAERTNIKPEMISTFNNFNAFADPDVNRRIHIKKSADYFKTFLAKAIHKIDTRMLVREALIQNKIILSGNPVGWSAPSLMYTAKMIDSLDAQEQAALTKDKIMEFYQHKLKDNSNWPEREKLANIIFRHRRDNTPITPDLLASIVKKEPPCAPFIEILQLVDKLATELAISTTPELNPTPRNFSDFISPNAIKEM